MKTIKLKPPQDAYPVGENIQYYIKTCQEIADILEENFKDQRVCFWCTGSSGSIISALIINNLKTIESKIVYVRKPDEKRHQTLSISKHNYEDYLHFIVDDFVYSGKSIERIIDEINRMNTEYESGINLYGLLLTGYIPYDSYLKNYFKFITSSNKL